MKLKASFSTLLFLMFISKSLAQGDIIPSHSRQGAGSNEITFNCESFGNLITIGVVSLRADSSSDTETSMDTNTHTKTFTVTPSDEKAAYCEVGGVSTDLIYFGGEQIITYYYYMAMSVKTLDHNLLPGPINSLCSLFCFWWLE